MAVYKRTYAAYQGSFTPAWSRFMILPRYSFANSFGAPLESSIAAMSLVYSGVFDRHPRVLQEQPLLWIEKLCFVG